MLKNKIYTKAIKIKSIKSGVPDLHILIAEENDCYFGICLDTGISIHYNKSDNMKDAIKYISETIAVGSLSQLAFCAKKSKEKTSIFPGKITDPYFWEVYENLYLPTKLTKLNEFFNKYDIDEIISNIEDLYEISESE